MAATPLSLFAALTAKSAANAPVRDDTTKGSGFDFAALVSASSETNRNSAKNTSSRDDWQRSTHLDNSSTKRQDRIITPREAQHALDRLDRMSASANASTNVRASGRTDHTDVSANTRVEASVTAESSTETAAPVDPVSSQDIAEDSTIAANDNTTLTQDIDVEALAALKAQLQAIIDSDTPASVQDITEDLPAADLAAALTLFPSSSALIDAQASVDTGAPLLSIRQILNRLHQALNVTAEVNATVTVAANAEVDAAANQEVADAALPAALNTDVVVDSDVAADLEVVADSDAAPEKGDEQALQADATTTIVTPLAQSLLVIPTVQAKADVTVATAAPTEAVAAIDVSAKPVSIDTLIPSLELKADEKKTALPDVELPKTSAHVQASAEVKTDAAPQPVPAAIPSKLEQQLQALTVLQQTPAANGEVKADANVKPALATNAIGAVSPLTGIGATAGVSSTVASNVVTLPSNVINNAPIREQVQVAITKAKADGVDQITIQLDPVGLGRVEVKLHTHQDGQTTLSFLVDKPETFDALSRDARHLERALQDSGLKADSGGMQFNLRQQTHADTGGGRGQSSQAHASADISTSVSTTNTAASQTRTYRLGIQDGIDIHA